MTPTQRKLLALMATGRRLVWFGDNGPELDGFQCWPQKRTVRAMVRGGHLRWLPYNPAQAAAGICELVNKKGSE